ncbi:hypothetical protein BACCAP_01946 [Pseudoflavonifractor capillosus ATCC 29799]|uniref:Uncharacterized protein n=1 Tax=Pseudoflavonifractor capillosus ATCC 29799 TaxID=411467 RepID=A6NUR2_9FIRM|nr:hypothetical protein BACCAP_01946 [Pseudoflavonifractor capillosus ATCC 29799]
MSTGAAFGRRLFLCQQSVALGCRAAYTGARGAFCPAMPGRGSAERKEQ